MTEENTNESGEQNASSENNTSEAKYTAKEWNEKIWRDHIPKELATDSSMADIKTAENLAKSYVNAQKMVGADKLPKPQKNWSKEEWAKFNKQIGMPNDPTDYVLGKPEDYPEGVGYAEETEDAFKKIAHDNGLSKRQANKVWQSLVKTTAEGIAMQMQTNTQNLNSKFNDLKKEYGQAYNERLKAADNMINKFDVDGEFRKWAKETGAITQPELIRFAMKIASNFSEDTIKTDEKSFGSNTPREAQAKLNKIYSDKKHPFHDQFDPGYDAAKNEVAELIKQSFPEDFEK